MENQTELLVRKLSLSYAELDKINARLERIKSQLETSNTELDKIKSESATTKSQLEIANSELELTKYRLETAISELGIISNSYGWRLILFLYKLVNLFFPSGSLRRKIAVIIWNFGRMLQQGILKVYRKLSIGLQYVIKILPGSGDPKKRRRINTRSKKIVYIGHSYHNKTKSTAFLTDYLKQFFEVELILDESWLGKPFPDLSFIDKSYLGVIFFQLLPPPNIIQNIKNTNIIYFPMYDQSGRLDLEYWNDYRNLKIINFSKTLHNNLEGWGFESIFIRYFPKPEEFIPGNTNEVFFWQRITDINIKTINSLLGDYDIKIHMHKLIDPNHQFIQPSEENEKKYQITYSDWFETKEEMWNLIKQKGIYISPREFEGIGLSFLEAMAMGKAVVAVNNPTMNEYIEDKKTGYLFDLSEPKKITLANIEEVQRNAYDYVSNGYRRWENDKHKIIDFIKGKKIKSRQ